MNFQDELFKGQDAYAEEYGYPDIVFVRYDVWCEMFPLGPFTPGKGISAGKSRYIPLRTCDGPMFQFCDRAFMERALNSVDLDNTPLITLKLLRDPEPKIADWNSNYATPVAAPYDPEIREISIELMKRYKESF